MRALFDINVLIALADASHQHHERARDWFAAHIDAGWASCPLTENGFVRILSQPGYPRPVPVAVAVDLLGRATTHPAHAFWPDDVSVLDARTIDRTRVHGPRQLTDVYLLALAVAHSGRFVTFDGGIDLPAVHRARAEHVVVI